MKTTAKKTTGKINEELNYIKYYKSRFNFKGLLLSEIDLLMFLVSFQENNDKVQVTNKWVTENVYNNFHTTNNIRKIFKSLTDYGLIETNVEKTYYVNEKKYSNRRTITITQLTYDIINGIVTPQENLKKINDTSTTTKKETPTQTLKIVEDVKPIEIKQTIKKQTIMKNNPTKNERSLEEELLAIDKKEKEETHSINLNEPIGVADLRPGKKVITSSPSIKSNLKMYKEDEVMGTTEAIRLLFPVVDNRTKQLQSSIDSFNGTIVDGKPFELTPAILIRILNASYPELIERVENRIIENQVA